MFDLTQHGDVAVLHMSHGKANTIDVDFCEGLAERLEKINKSPSKALVLTSEGNIFSAGLDLVRVLEEGSEFLKRLGPVLATVLERLFFYPMPVVAAVNGHAIAGGCVLASAADHRIMARGTGRIGTPELLVGVPLPTVALEIMRFVAGSQYLQAVMYSGATYLAEEAVGLGLADELVEPPNLLDRAVEKAEKLGAIESQIFQLSKKQIRQPVLERIRDTQSIFETSVQDVWGAPETLEAIRGYVSQTLRKG